MIHAQLREMAAWLATLMRPCQRRSAERCSLLSGKTMGARAVLRVVIDMLLGGSAGTGRLHDRSAEIGASVEVLLHHVKKTVVSRPTGDESLSRRSFTLRHACTKGSSDSSPSIPMGCASLLLSTRQRRGPHLSLLRSTPPAPRYRRHPRNWMQKTLAKRREL